MHDGAGEIDDAADPDPDRPYGRAPPRLGVPWNRTHDLYFTSRRRNTRLQGDRSSDVCSSDLTELTARRIDTPNTHGSGCAFSAAIAAGLARGLDPLAATREAKAFITRAIESALEIGHGQDRKSVV